MRCLASLVLVASLSFLHSAAAAPADHGVVLLAGDDGKPIAGVKLSRADVHATVRGSIAQTTLTLTFFNDQPRQLGGNLLFPLPSNATVTGYALDVGGEMVDGVAVEKQQARVAYEKELNKSVDPGLVEHADGNVFRTRVYPVLPNNTRTVRIRYLSEVQTSGNGTQFSVPMPCNGVLDECNLRVEILDGQAKNVAAPTIEQRPLRNAAVKREADRWVIEASGKAEAVGGELRVSLPGLAKQLVMVEKSGRRAAPSDAAAGPDSAEAAATPAAVEHFFVVRDTPPPANRPPAPAAVRRIAVLWDASRSRSDADKSRELTILKELCARLGDVRLDLTLFRDVPEAAVTFEIRSGKSEKVTEHLRGITYDGATNLQSAIATLTTRGADSSRPSFCVLFTDGMGNWGSGGMVAADVPVFAISGGRWTNHAALDQLCRRSGGAHLNLNQLSDQDATAAIGEQPYGLISVECDPGKIVDVTPTGGAPLSGDAVVICGRLLAPEAAITLNYGFGRQITHRETITVRGGGAWDARVLATEWARRRVAELSAEPEINRDALLKLGRDFNLVTPHTSLLVLETLDQYVRYKVVPPRSQPDLYRQYIALADQRRTEVAQSAQAKLTYAMALWDQRVKWWNTDWKKVAAEREAEAAADARARAARARQQELADSAGRAGSGMRLRSDAEKREIAAARGAQGGGGGGGGGGGLFGSSGGGVPDFSNAPNFDLASSNPANRVGAIAPPAAGRRGAAADNTAPTAVATIEPWDSKAPYMDAVRRAGPQKAYQAYLEQRKVFANSPAFYIDCADYLLRFGSRPLGLRVLSNVVEMQIDDPRLLRIAATRLLQAGEHDLCIALYEKVLHLRPEEPQSLRDLALALADRADALAAAARKGAGPLDNRPTDGRALADYMRSIELLNKVVTTSWDRFAEIEAVSLMEANRILASLRRLPGQAGSGAALDPQLIGNLDVDLRVVLTWDAQGANAELQVVEPSGERTLPGVVSWAGGMVSRPISEGFGPQEYLLRKLKPGPYKIQARLIGIRQQEPTGPVTLHATVITNFGRPDEKRQYLTARVKDSQDLVDIGTVRLNK